MTKALRSLRQHYIILYHYMLHAVCDGVTLGYTKSNRHHFSPAAKHSNIARDISAVAKHD